MTQILKMFITVSIFKTDQMQTGSSSSFLLSFSLSLSLSIFYSSEWYIFKIISHFEYKFKIFLERNIQNRDSLLRIVLSLILPKHIPKYFWSTCLCYKAKLHRFIWISGTTIHSMVIKSTDSEARQPNFNY